ncbi:hypothetical protein [Hymenobacter glacialis]|uniref:Uncharacterized protein n=1 Tax=Hymenobacter glacialis TaxID=1908236 RepID=A0A1G1T352_9BACT|nr:hypothetical protein [Hymenobacter glacialis]OGX85274.1 hypothetical protein BEN48_14815 [Hymenobacter glacialis]
MKLQHLVITAVLGLNATSSFGQVVQLADAEIDNAGPSKLIFATLTNGRCEEADQLADKDIADGMPFLCLFGSIAPTAMMPSDF